MKNEEINWIDRLEQLIHTKAFQELTTEEKDFVLRELDSEEQYEVMRKLSPMFDGMRNEDIPQPRDKTLEFLKQNLPLKTSLWSKWLDLQMPAYATVLLVMLSCFLTWKIATPANPLVIKQTISTIDTIYVASKPDTIFKEKVVYRFAKSQDESKSRDELKEVIPNQPEALPIGVSMKDKEELQGLLVSGSR